MIKVKLLKSDRYHKLKLVSSISQVLLYHFHYQPISGVRNYIRLTKGLF